jgi:hypothetical protein
MAGLDPAIHHATGKMDGRLKGGHDKLRLQKRLL